MSLVYCAGKHGYLYADKGSQSFGDRYVYMSRNERLQEMAEFLFHLLAGIIAAYTAWNYHSKDGRFIQIIVSVLAFLFGIFYLVFFLGLIVLQNENKRNQYLDMLAQGAQAA